MSRRPIGEVAMSVAERSRRKRAKAKAQAQANGLFRPARRVMTNTSMGIPIDVDGNQAAGAAEKVDVSSTLSLMCQPPAAVDFLAGGPEAIAARIFERVSIEMARDIAMALQQRLLQGGSWPTWRLPLM